MDSAQRLPADEPLRRFDAQRELAQRQLGAQGTLAERVRGW
jgi:hypothetical protein